VSLAASGFVRPHAAVVARGRVLERLEQENYTDPTAPMRRTTSSSTSSSSQAELATGGGSGSTSVVLAELLAAAAEDDDGLDDDGAPLKRKRRKKDKRALAAAAAATTATALAACPALAPTSFARALEDSSAAATGWVPSWFSAAAGPAVRPRRWYCAVCGSLGVYRCRACGARFCSIKCNEVHKETRCLKLVR
jgi:zinc finger HIT domain-containing protein 1